MKRMSKVDGSTYISVYTENIAFLFIVIVIVLRIDIEERKRIEREKKRV